MRTSINGKPAEWPEHVQKLWCTYVSIADPKWFSGVVVEASNYFTPRPCRNEYDRGSNKAGFTYTWRAAGDGLTARLADRHVGQVSWPETFNTEQDTNP